MSPKDEKKKGIFGKAVDAFTSRDEKEEAEEAKKQAREAELKAKAAEHAAEMAKERAEEAEEKMKELEDEKKRAEAEKRQQQMLKEMKERSDKVKAELAAEQPKIIAEHTLQAGETPSHLALKYYGNATEPYWKLILEANKENLPENIKHIQPGMVFKIPELPEELKKK